MNNSRSSVEMLILEMIECYKLSWSCKGNEDKEDDVIIALNELLWVLLLIIPLIGYFCFLVSSLTEPSILWRIGTGICWLLMCSIPIEGILAKRSVGVKDIKNYLKSIGKKKIRRNYIKKYLYDFHCHINKNYEDISDWFNQNDSIDNLTILIEESKFPLVKFKKIDVDSILKKINNSKILVENKNSCNYLKLIK